MFDTESWEAWGSIHRRWGSMDFKFWGSQSSVWKIAKLNRSILAKATGGVLETSWLEYRNLNEKDKVYAEKITNVG